VTPRGDWLPAPLDVYVPDEGIGGHILPRSGVVGSPTDQGAVTIDFEGSKFGQFNDYVRRVERAAMRHHQRYPTIARLRVPPGAVTRVGSYDGVAVQVDDPGALSAYLQAPVEAGRLESLLLPPEEPA
jgi:citrate lyase gamma subunit